MHKELPIQLNSNIKMECWTYCKMAIIQTLPNYMNWLSAHMSIYYDEIWNSIYFGSGPNPHEPDYFRDIIDIEELDVFSISANDIIDKIRLDINEGYYYIVYIRDKEDISHEIFIYGYDDSKFQFLALVFEQGKGFTPNSISFSAVENGYISEIEFSKEHPEMYYNRRKFGYVMSRIIPVNRYLSKNYAFDFFNKINTEVYGTRVDVHDNYGIDDFKLTYRYITGTACLQIVRKKLLEIKNIKDGTVNELLGNLKEWIFKLLEHKKIILSSMIWQEEKWSISNNRILELRKEYNLCCDIMENICYMFMKFLETADYKIIDRMINKIELLHHKEKITLGEYATMIREWYYLLIKEKFVSISQ